MTEPHSHSQGEQESMYIQVLGSGTSMGVPIIGCRCRVCTSTDPRDHRLRTSVFIRIGQLHLLIDTSSDFRQQMLRAGIDRLDAILFTHHHMDHISGMDDVRCLNVIHKMAIPIYASEQTMQNIRRVFAHAFDAGNQVSTVPMLIPHLITEQAFQIQGVRIQPIPLWHGDLPVFGFRIGNFAYCTDVSRIPEPSYRLLEGVQILILGALRQRPHPTHFSIDQAVAEARKIGARLTFFTHMTHAISHAETERELPEGIFLAYDGLELQLPYRDGP
ncbi:MAG: MBL fold metallo-hydrolase [Calditrichaeota bacterium]|nr:MAG: MBL fold metallo-hydrolase [Calditrichota bacterium]